MFRRVTGFAAASLAAIATIAGASTASATQVRVTVTNPGNGLALTPLYFGFHNGSVDLFDVGSTASAGIENLAELGTFNDPSLVDIREERLAQQADSVGGVALGTSIGAPGPLEPGESASFIVDLDAVANRFAFFAAMIIPSNDTFVGLDDPTGFALFDAAGNFLGPQTFNITGEFAYDAGTEVNNASATGGAAFVQGRTATDGAAEGGVIGRATSLSDFLGLTLANGTVLGGDIDFVTDPASFIFATITVEEVPLPPAIFLMGAGLAGLGLSSRRKKQAAGLS
ncbi:MAG: spondin domain-containing protein [Pseudomonadota bacterium]